MHSWHALTSDKALRILGSDAVHGLGAEEAAARLVEHGPNALGDEHRISAFSIFIRQFANLLMGILLGAIVLSVFIGEMVDALIIAIIVVFSAVLGFVQEYRSEMSMDALRGMLKPRVRVMRSGQEAEIENAELVPGDVVLLEAGDIVPADGRLLEAHSLLCDEASLTGESEPAPKTTDILDEATPLADRHNMVFTGSVLTAGRARALVVSTGMDTELGQIASAVSRVETETTPLEKRTGEIGRWLGLGALAVCIMAAGFGILREGLDHSLSLEFMVHMILFSITLAVAAVPEALAAIVTGALAIGMRQMAKENALIRKMPAVETLGCTTVICSDKTGTLTTGEMTVREILLPREAPGIAGENDTPMKTFDQTAGHNGANDQMRAFLTAALLCNNARFMEGNDGKQRLIGSATEGALLKAAANAGLMQSNLNRAYPRIEEFPFSSERKRMATVHSTDDEVLICVKGAPETILERCLTKLGPEDELSMNEKGRAAILEANDHLAARAMRVLAVACKRLPAGSVVDERSAESELTFLGLAAMMDPPRPETASAIETCRRVGIKPVMITGDHLVTAKAVAEEIGIFREGDLSLTGAELEKMDEARLAEIVDLVSVYARVSPLHKLAIVSAWQARGHVVAMTGDGVNDAPALRAADIGVAMGVNGAEVSKEAADMVLLDDNFGTIVKAVELGRWIYDNIKKYLAYLLRCNITEIAVIGGAVLALGPRYLPLLPAAILYINLATDGLPALALGVAPAEPDIMARPPRDASESVFSGDVRLFLLMGLLIETPVFFAVFYLSADDLALARTRLYFLFILTEMGLALNFRSMRFGVFAAPPHKLLVASVLWELALLAGLIQIPDVREAFGIELPDLNDLGLMLAFLGLVWLSMEAAKRWLSRREKGVS